MTYAFSAQTTSAAKPMFGLINKRDVQRAMTEAREGMYQSNVESYPALQAEIVEAAKRAGAATRPEDRKTPQGDHLGHGS